MISASQLHCRRFKVLDLEAAYGPESVRALDFRSNVALSAGDVINTVRERSGQVQVRTTVDQKRRVNVQ